MKCNLTMQMPRSKGAPKACPICGFDKSDQVIALMKAQREEAIAYIKMGFFGKAWYRLKKRFAKKAPALV